MAHPYRTMAVALLGVALAMTACSRPAGTTGPQSATSPTTTSQTTASGGSAATSATAATPSTSASEAPLAPETNPPGDIPDSQVFVAYQPPSAGFEVKVPEGWSRSEGAGTVSFTDKLNLITATWAPASAAPGVASVRSSDVPRLSAAGAAFQLAGVKQVKLPAGDAVLLTYQVNGQPNAVTGKRYRLDVEDYILYRNGTRADLILTSPVGADNVDPWRTVSQSFRWTR